MRSIRALTLVGRKGSILLKKTGGGCLTCCAGRDVGFDIPHQATPPIPGGYKLGGAFLSKVSKASVELSDDGGALADWGNNPHRVLSVSPRV
jgi:hypothetical protein